MATSAAHTRAVHDRTTIQLVTTIVAATFLAIGILGFIPGITSDYGDMMFAGHDSDAKLLGLFEVSVLHNIVHLAFGVIGLMAARMASTSRTYLIAGGAIYAVLTLYGLVIDRESGANFVPLNAADNVLHAALAVGMIGLGLAFSRDAATRR